MLIPLSFDAMCSAIASGRSGLYSGPGLDPDSVQQQMFFLHPSAGLNADCHSEFLRYSTRQPIKVNINDFGHQWSSVT